MILSCSFLTHHVCCTLCWFFKPSIFVRGYHSIDIYVSNDRVSIQCVFVLFLVLPPFRINASGRSAFVPSRRFSHWIWFLPGLLWFWVSFKETINDIIEHEMLVSSTLVGRLVRSLIECFLFTENIRITPVVHAWKLLKCSELLRIEAMWIIVHYLQGFAAPGGLNEHKQVDRP